MNVELPNAIVADGADRLRLAADFRRQRALLRTELLDRHANELAATPRWRRWWLRWRMEREVRIELDRRFPRRALYFAGCRDDR